MNLICENISKSFGNVVALKNVGLSIEPGEVRALLGGNGSGKSTLAKILSGSVKPDSGDITVFGEPYKIHSPAQAKKKQVVMTSQELSLLSNLTVEQNLSLCQLPTTGLHFTDNRKVEEAAETILAELNIQRLKDKTIDALAPNEKYMIEYAKALVQNPRILIIDEITSALFKEDVEIVKRSIQSLREKGCSIIFISHRMPEVFDICDSVTVMRNGEVVDHVRIDSVEEYQLLSMMTGRTITQEPAGVKRGQSAEGGTGKTLLSIKNMKLNGFGSEIDLDVAEGEIIGVAGLQGHGQSALVRQIFGMYHNADMEINGERVHIASPRQAVKHKIAFISGDRGKDGVFREQSIIENLRVVRNLIFREKSKDEEELLKKYKVVYGSPRQKLTSLSGGNQQKVVIGRWICTQPRILLADDPTKGIDVQARTDVHKIMSELACNGSVVIMVSSDSGELINLTRHAPKARVIVMYEGKIAKTLYGDNITEENIEQAALQGGS